MNVKASAFTYLALEPDLPAMFLADHTVGQRQALPRTLTHFFGGEEGVEYAGPNGFGNTGSAVSDGNLGHLAFVARANSDGSFLPAVAHHIFYGVSGIDDEIENDL